MRTKASLIAASLLAWPLANAGYFDADFTNIDDIDNNMSDSEFISEESRVTATSMNNILKALKYLKANQGSSFVNINEAGANVGIGTTQPSEKLDVDGNIKATAFIGDGSQLTGISAGFFESDTTNNIIKLKETSAGVARTDSTNVAITDSGQLIVGYTALTSPDSRLEIVGGDVSLIHSDLNIIGDTPEIEFMQNINNTNDIVSLEVNPVGIVRWELPSNGGEFHFGNIFHALDLAGNKRVDIHGDALITGGLTVGNPVSSNSNTNLEGRLRIQKAQNAWGGITLGNATHDSSNIEWKLTHSKNNKDFAVLASEGLGTDESFAFTNYFYDEKVVAFPNPINVGIGTTQPSEKLDVDGNIKATAFIGDGSQLTGISAGFFESDTTNNIIKLKETSAGVARTDWTNVAITDSGQLIVGDTILTSPDSSLEVIGGDVSILGSDLRIVGSTPSIDFMQDFSNTNDIVSLEVLPAGNVRWELPLTGGEFRFGNIFHALDLAGNKKVDIDGELITTGNIGIGTTQPSEKLDVNGKIRIQSNTLGVCDATKEGAIAYESNTTRGDFKGCVKTATDTYQWKSITGVVE